MPGILVSQRSALLAVVVAAVLGGAAVVGAVLSRHPVRFLAGRAYRSAASRAALRATLERRGQELARELARAGGAVRAASPGSRPAALRALQAGQELDSVSSALLPLIDAEQRAEPERRLGALRRALSDLDREAGAGAWEAAARAIGPSCAAGCLGPRDRCWAAAGAYAARCEGLALEAAGCVSRCP